MDTSLAQAEKSEHTDASQPEVKSTAATGSKAFLVKKVGILPLVPISNENSTLPEAGLMRSIAVARPDFRLKGMPSERPYGPSLTHPTVGACR